MTSIRPEQRELTEIEESSHSELEKSYQSDVNVHSGKFSSEMYPIDVMWNTPEAAEDLEIDGLFRFCNDDSLGLLVGCEMKLQLTLGCRGKCLLLHRQGLLQTKITKEVCVTNDAEESSHSDLEKSSQLDVNVHSGIFCDSCEMCPIVGKRYKCQDCYEEHTGVCSFADQDMERVTIDGSFICVPLG
ncbi:hypothetical protein FRX31_011004 [Thalictrum thalictroides]|uniref:Uncharacterized protein n=1 Tax=Thalictrum thalictroides TaxID=46969 RepID=A0A7J6WPW7_THATH|nr:hypothetical protein FRX31_011004 [Thalictrum thalictroides]